MTVVQARSSPRTGSSAETSAFMQIEALGCRHLKAHINCVAPLLPSSPRSVCLWLTCSQAGSSPPEAKEDLTASRLTVCQLGQLCWRSAPFSRTELLAGRASDPAHHVASLMSHCDQDTRGCLSLAKTRLVPPLEVLAGFTFSTPWTERRESAAPERGFMKK